MTQFRYKKAGNKDKQALFDLSVLFTRFNTMGSGKRREFFTKNWRIEFKKEVHDGISKSNYITFICYAVDKGEEPIPVGYVTSYVCKTCFEFVVWELFVKKDYRKQGVGPVLIEKAVSYGKKYKCPIYVEVYTWNRKAITFYKKMGFFVETHKLKKLILR